MVVHPSKWTIIPYTKGNILYMYISKYISIYIYIHYISVHTYIYIQINTCIYINIYIYVSIYISIHIIYIYIYISINNYIYISTYQWNCTSKYTSVSNTAGHWEVPELALEVSSWGVSSMITGWFFFGWDSSNSWSMSSRLWTKLFLGYPKDIPILGVCHSWIIYVQCYPKKKTLKDDIRKIF